MIRLNHTAKDLGLYWLTLTGLLLWVAIGCAPTPPPVEQPMEPPPVASDLRVTHDDHDILLQWNTNRGEDDLLSGYNIYLSAEQSIVDLPPTSEQLQEHVWLGATYPGDTDPRTDVESAEITGLEYGTKYYLHIRTVGINGTIGPPSMEITVVPRPEGACTLSPRFSDGEDGFNFVAQEYVPARNSRNDLYLYVRQDSVFAASPQRLNPANRPTAFYPLGPSQSIDDFPRPDYTGDGQESVYLREQYSYLLLTAEENHVKFRVNDIELSGDVPQIQLDYICQLRPGERAF